MENEPQAYKLRELYPRYYLYLGALAATSLSPPSEWTEVYQQRLEEVSKEILENGGTIPGVDDGKS